MIKYIKALFRGAFKILFAYPKIRKYAKNKDKYPIEERYAFARKLIKIAVHCLGINIKAEGLEKIDISKPCLMVANHQGMMDALTMIYLFDKPITFVAKKETLKFPFVGKVCYFIDGIFLDRDNVRDAVRMLKLCKENLNNGRSVLIFPEGTRTKDENYYPGEYKAGALKPAFDTKVSIVALGMDGGYKAFSTKYTKDLNVNVKYLHMYDSSEYETKTTADIASDIEIKTKEFINNIRKQ